MESCEQCPGGEGCHGRSLAPVLRRVYALHAAGVTNKFDLLDRLSDEDEALLEQHARGLTTVCWTRAALTASATLLAEQPADDDTPPAEAVEARLAAILAAFERFPWRIDDLVDAAPELYDLVAAESDGQAAVSRLGRRPFGKLCKRAVWG
ncbi:hypothetical protein ACN2MM_05620 [Alkalilimnicola ehrlichii MLHE-1]|uniref:Uncharacterized protein n=1 Tax=Alkalilimnicola ehrlichii (strain ATCC BAA-1101 / DSM 17681 / MLHE-1) TaxID=187272 RepID=Q0A9Y8_ALKEH|nr:hypothetical protein [Alkalilimnicola ehrlichii]ABI56349.1 hypothetical protein Mlg_0996 [Alkalilimnicola ehrlichii MLHE-1]